MESNLAGKIALITGGSKGIGRSIALALAREGTEVAIAARGIDDLKRTALDITSETGRRCLPVQVDLGTLEGCQKFVRHSAEHFGAVDILVCCANISGTKSGPFLSIPDEQWVHHLNVKYLSVVRCSREVLPYMQAKGWGRIVIISGMATRLVRLRAINAGPACAALTNFGKQLAAQVAKDAITVNTVHPDFTMTPLLQGQISAAAQQRGVPEEQIAKELDSIFPRGKVIQPEEIANLTLFLCSDLAQAVNGQSIAADAAASISVSY